MSSIPVVRKYPPADAVYARIDELDLSIAAIARDLAIPYVNIASALSGLRALAPDSLDALGAYLGMTREQMGITASGSEPRLPKFRSADGCGVTARMRSLGMTQQELADAAGVTRGTLGNLLCGRNAMRDSAVRRLAEVLGSTPEELGLKFVGRGKWVRDAGPNAATIAPQAARMAQDRDGMLLRPTLPPKPKARRKPAKQALMPAFTTIAAVARRLPPNGRAEILVVVEANVARAVSVEESAAPMITHAGDPC